MSDYELIQFDGRTVAVIAPEDLEALESRVAELEQRDEWMMTSHAYTERDKLRADLAEKNELVKRQAKEILDLDGEVEELLVEADKLRADLAAVERMFTGVVRSVGMSDEMIAGMIKNAKAAGR